MKNIHLIPTDKPSRLHITGKLSLYPNGFSPKSQGLCKNQHIYITNDEEIKPNTYCLINGVLCKTEIREGKIVSRQLTGGATMDICKSEYLEIILTTDNRLIADGVQEIDDEFLQWFVKNSSCEKVEVEFIEDNWGYYEIIIPQEEPKQENCCTPAGQIKRYVDCKGCDRKPKQESHICKHCGVETTQSDDECYAKQETLEKLAERPLYFELVDKKAESNNTIDLDAYAKGVQDGVIWQQERSYSEEEVIEILLTFRAENPRYIEEWLEQFKKK